MSSLCNFCGFEMPDGEKVCTRCGRAAEKSSPGEATLPVCRCSKCGKEFPAGVKFCSECGGKVSYGSAAMDKKGALPGKEFSVDMGGGVSMTLIRIEPGTFMMGSPEDELGRYDNEEQHSVTLTRPFWIGKYPVTQREYEVLMDTNPSDSKGDELPVENVSWDDAHAFCEHLNRQYAGRLPAGYRFDLPTEAQWEYACRAGTTTALNNGKNLTSEDERCPNLDEVAWYDENSGYRTHKVGRKKPNAWGLYDMHGNVLEWCRDWYEKEYASDAEFLNGQPKSGERVFRGGCDARFCRSANRDYAPPDDGDFLGFRLALVPGEQLNYNDNALAPAALPG